MCAKNPDQTDTDGDGVGDACDTCTDTDGDEKINPGFPADTCPADIYVKSTAAGANNGTSWTDAYTSLQAALAAAQTHDDIWVAATPNPADYYKPGTARASTLQLRNNVSLYGAFADIESETPAAFNLANRDFVDNPTILQRRVRNPVLGGLAEKTGWGMIVEPVEGAARRAMRCESTHSPIASSAWHGGSAVCL